MSRYRRGYASDNVTLKDNLEDALIDSIESDDEYKKYKKYRSSIKSFYTVSMKRFTSSDVKKNIKYDAKCDFKLLGSLRNQLRNAKDENEKLNLLDLYSFQLKKVTIENNLGWKYYNRVSDVVLNELVA
tara:strand:+ start:3897 stop:4283 length:387 start_codon:yes stop_codon:yes gene_type:complete